MYRDAPCKVGYLSPVVVAARCRTALPVPPLLSLYRLCADYQQWTANYGYGVSDRCSLLLGKVGTTTPPPSSPAFLLLRASQGEVSAVLAGMEYGQWMSQYDMRRLGSGNTQTFVTDPLL